tara:strand:+ start:42 stop:227 length:186 start_codon:yes stop_codon:yes gene_type:complete
MVVFKPPSRITNKFGFQEKIKLIVKVYFPTAEKLGKRLFLHVLSVPLNRDMTRRGDIISGE